MPVSGSTLPGSWKETLGADNGAEKYLLSLSELARRDGPEVIDNNDLFDLGRKTHRMHMLNF